MAKVRRCFRDGCPYPAMAGKRTCGFHWLLKQPIEVQEQYAERRLRRAAEPHRARVPAEEWPPGARWCSGCQSFIPLWYCSGSRCRACASRASHRARAERTYDWPPGLTFDLLLERQGGRCAICGCTPRTRRLAVDHDHETGLVRGLLCSRCNHDLLGAAHDDVEVLRRAVRYLDSPPAQRASVPRAPHVTPASAEVEAVGEIPF